MYSRNQPLPTTSTLSQAALFIAMGVSTIAATWGHWTVKERMTRSKFAQHLQGVGVLTYWISNYCWDFLTFIPPAFIIFGLLGLCGVDDLVSNLLPVQLSNHAFLSEAVVHGDYFL